jgi:diguanylate cyclase (GGDEF)-like protein
MAIALSETSACEPGVCILVADDDPDILMLLGHVLDREGYRIVQASDGIEALQLVKETSPDLCLLDVSMPGLDGYAVCRALQAQGPAAPPVIFLTARADTASRVNGLDAGAADYVVKPFDAAELRARVRAALRTKIARDALLAEAATDALTGLLNRGQLVEAAESLIAAARDEGGQLACVMIDLDRFKLINDTYGHVAGDVVLAEASRRFSRAVRRTDVVIRYGGEEFLVLLPEADTAGALGIGARLRASLSAPVAVAADDAGGPFEVPVRASFGVACWRDGMELDDLVAAADAAMYEAKKLGRDRIELAR